MAKRFKEGEEALCEYQKVRFFPFGNSPGSSFILTTNPFSYLNAWLDSEIRNFGKSSPKKRRLEKAKYFCQLAESFDLSARQSRLPVKGTLLYYAHLNLVKAFLLVNGINLEESLEHHGLTFQAKSEREIKIQPKVTEGVNIFWEFSKILGDKVDDNSGKKISIDELLDEMPEVHEIGHALTLLQDKRKFLPVDIRFCTNKKIRNKLFYEIEYEDKFRNNMPVHLLNSGAYKSNLDLLEKVKKIRFRSKKKVTYTTSSAKSWKQAYSKLSMELEDLGATVMLTTKGYRYYINLKKGKLHRLTSTLALMYYLGSVARYRPTLYDKLIQGELQPIVNEVVETCPRQFYYLLVSRITESPLAIPLAKI